MYIFWIILGGIATLLYIALDFVVAFYSQKQTKNEGKAIWPGKKIYYVAGNTILVFTIISAIYFAGVNYVGAPHQFICWPFLSIILSLPPGMAMSASLRKASFE